MIMEKPKVEIPAATEGEREPQADKGIKKPAAEKVYEKEGGIRVKEFEYRDKDGNILGKAVVKIQERPAEGGERAARYDRLLDFRLMGQKDGKPTEIDVLNLVDVGNTEIRIPKEESSVFRYDDENDAAIVPLPESPIQMAIILHELGHAKQLKESGDDVYSLYPSLPAFSDLPEVPEKIKKIKSSLADLGPKMTTLLDQIEQSAEKILTEKLDESSPLVQDFFTLWREYHNELYKGDPVEQIAERNATARALHWMRRIRSQSGVNLFKNLRDLTVAEKKAEKIGRAHV